MNWTSIIIALISCLIFTSFVILGVYKFTLLASYSAYSSKWAEKVPIKGMNLWSIVTFTAAILLVPVLIELGVNNPWQFLGFFTPLYLILVSFTPEWQTNKSQYKVHVVGALSCAIAAFGWLIFVQHQLLTVIVVADILLLISLLTQTLKKSYVFWLEMIMFASVYISIFI